MYFKYLKKRKKKNKRASSGVYKYVIENRKKLGIFRDRVRVRVSFRFAMLRHKINLFNPLMPGGNKRLYVLKQTFSF